VTWPSSIVGKLPCRVEGAKGRNREFSVRGPGSNMLPLYTIDLRVTGAKYVWCVVNCMHCSPWHHSAAARSSSFTWFILLGYALPHPHPPPFPLFFLLFPMCWNVIRASVTAVEIFPYAECNLMKCDTIERNRNLLAHSYLKKKHFITLNQVTRLLTFWCLMSTIVVVPHR